MSEYDPTPESIERAYSALKKGADGAGDPSPVVTGIALGWVLTSVEGVTTGATAASAIRTARAMAEAFRRYASE